VEFFVPITKRTRQRIGQACGFHERLRAWEVEQALVLARGEVAAAIRLAGRNEAA